MFVRINKHVEIPKIETMVIFQIQNTGLRPAGVTNGGCHCGCFKRNPVMTYLKYCVTSVTHLLPSQKALVGTPQRLLCIPCHILNPAFEAHPDGTPVRSQSQ